MKKTIYISIEIKNREYDSQLILAARAAQRGYRVYLGTHAAIYAVLQKKKKGGVYLDKGTQPLTRMKWIKDRVDAIFILDAELSPIMNEQYARQVFPSRIYPGTETYIDRYFTVGPIIEKVAKEYSSELNSKVFSSGWPRIEVWSNLVEYIYSKEIDDLKSRYGEYAIFASSFGVIKNPLETRGYPSAGLVQENRFDSIEHKLEIYQKFREAVSYIKKWDSIPEFPTLIVRPHTSEQISVWRQELKGLNKTWVLNRGDITPWIHGSIGLIHNGSTTSIQAFLANKPTIILDDLTPKHVIDFPSRISQFVINEDSKFLQPNFEGLDFNKKFDPKAITESISNLDQSPCQFILEHIDGLCIKHESKVNSINLIVNQFRAKSLKRLFGLLRHEIIWRIGKSNLNSQLHFVPGGLDRSKIKRIVSVSKEFEALSYKRKTINLWEITKKDSPHSVV